MSLITRTLILTLSTAAWISCASGGVPAPESPSAAPAAAEPAPDTIAEGRREFLGACSGCHGEDALGGLGPALAGAQRDAETLYSIVRDGRGLMPPLDPGLISDEAIEQVAAFLNSLGG
jgi:mono/diheme cytochrome c family protein